MRWRSALVVGLVPMMIGMGCGSEQPQSSTGAAGDGAGPTVTESSADLDTTTSAPTDGASIPSGTTLVGPAMLPDDVVALFVDTMAEPAGRFQIVEPQDSPLLGSYTTTRVGEYDQRDGTAWVTLGFHDFEDGGLFDMTVGSLTDLSVIDGDSVSICAEDRSPVWEGGPRDDKWWELFVDGSGIYTQVEAGPFPWVHAFDLAIANPELVVSAEHRGMVGNRDLYLIEVSPEVVAPIVTSMQVVERSGEPNLGGPVGLTVEVDSGFITSIAFEADEVASALLNFGGDDTPFRAQYKYAHELTLERLAAAHMPAVDLAASSCPDQINAITP